MKFSCIFLLTNEYKSLISALKFSNKKAFITISNYYFLKRTEAPDGAVYQFTIPQDSCDFIKTLKFRFPMLGPKDENQRLKQYFCFSHKLLTFHHIFCSLYFRQSIFHQEIL